MLRFPVSRPLAGIVAAVVLAACASESSGPPSAGDTTPPTVLSVTPANGATGVAAGTNVTVNFSEPVAPASVTPATFSVGSAAGTIVVTGSSATFTPSAPFAGGIAYAVSVAGARDTAGNAMAAPFASTFTTFAGPASANAGPDQHVSFSVAVTLNASASTGGGLTYAWSQIAGPAVTLAPAGAQAGFTAPGEPEALEFEVSVTDGATSDKDTVVVFVWEDRNHAYYVAPGGNDANSGTRAAPFATVQAAITAADVAGNGGDVYVAGGVYEQSVVLKARVSVYGGFVPGTWRRSLSQETAIRGGTTAVSGADAENLTLDGLTIEAGNASAAGISSIALLLNNSVNVRIHGNTIIAYGAGAGTSGVAGTNGLTGSNGGSGQSAGFCSPPRAGGGGGSNYVAGGGGGNGGFAGGFNGSGGGASGAAAGGGGGGGGSTFNDGGNGGNGRTGAQGADGARGAAFGAVSPAGYVPADGISGTNGTNGSAGGGGGGGGGTAADCGPGGGGGGGGGQRGTLATPGTGGGASIGILLLGTTTAEIVNNSINTGTGGNGGLGRAGGNGGTGGNGGSGGNHGCEFPLNFPCTGDGGDGGDGGTGGRGGHGGGGGGGPSIGIVEAASASSVRTSNGFTLGTGGTGGTSPGNAGLAGETAQHKKLT
jgi:hypothetical protein